MNRILNYFSILGLIGLCLTIWLDNHQMSKNIDPKIIVLLLVGTVIIYARGGVLSSILKIAISVLGLGYTLAKINLISIRQFKDTATYITVILITLFGIYVMFGGLNKNKDDIHLTLNRKTGKLKRRWF